ncbi:Psmd10, partial [Symbiodinium microadriaticum]
MLFPMYTVAADVLLQMTKVAWGMIVDFRDDLGRAAFVSHQWLTQQHPDPEFQQFRVLQDAIERILNSSGSLSLDPATEAVVPTAKPRPVKDFQTKALFFWYDYFSCPQLHDSALFVDRITSRQEQTKAINSIPAYVTRCDFFLALCPVLDCRVEGKVLTPATWSSRGWCRLERVACELSPNSTWIVIRSATSIEAVGTLLSFQSGAVGEGDFGVPEDRKKLAPVMRKILMQKLNHCLRAGDLPGFRRHFNLQTNYFRGLLIEPVFGLLPSCEGGDDVAAEFLHQNGFRRVNEVDGAGWRPLHYATLAGNVEVLRGLLEQRAQVNGRTWKDEPSLGFPPTMSALDLSLFYRHHEVTRLLLAARAHLVGGVSPAVMHAAGGDNAEGIRLVCAMGAVPLSQNLLGNPTFATAAALAATEALEELLVQGRPSSMDLSRALFDATMFRGGSAELVQRLIGLRADVDFQLDLPRDWSRLGRLLLAVKSWQHRRGRTSALTTIAYHLHGSTPLMQAIRSAQFDGAAALIAAGARLDLCNCRKWTAADFARGQSIPQFLQLGLEGDLPASAEEDEGAESAPSHPSQIDGDGDADVDDEGRSRRVLLVRGREEMASSNRTVSVAFANHIEANGTQPVIQGIETSAQDLQCKMNSACSDKIRGLAHVVSRSARRWASVAPRGVGAASLIFEETIDEGGQPEEELEEPSHPDQEFHNAVKAKVDALNMLGLAWFNIMEEAIDFYPNQPILDSSQSQGQQFSFFNKTAKTSYKNMGDNVGCGWVKIDDFLTMDILWRSRRQGGKELIRLQTRYAFETIEKTLDYELEDEVVMDGAVLTAAPMLFPMYTVAADVLLKMTQVEPHEKLKAWGQLVDFSDDLGRAAFVSHQWLTKKHPDPDFQQLRTLQDAVKRILTSSGSISLDPGTEAVVPTAKPRPVKDFQTKALFFWYDYFSCPQLHHLTPDEVVVQRMDSRIQQADAITSIPAYVARCDFFLGLCPVLDCPAESRVLTAATWSSRGWCRLERAARELSPSSTWILIRSETSVETVGTLLSFPSGCVGEGEFGVVEDRQKLAP